MIEAVNPHRLPDEQRLTGTGDLALFMGGSADSWTGLFYALFAKSDPPHRARLLAAFPVHGAAYLFWQSLPEPTVGALTAMLGQHAAAQG